MESDSNIVIGELLLDRMRTGRGMGVAETGGGTITRRRSRRPRTEIMFHASPVSPGPPGPPEPPAGVGADGNVMCDYLYRNVVSKIKRNSHILLRSFSPIVLYWA